MFHATVIICSILWLSAMEMFHAMPNATRHDAWRHHPQGLDQWMRVVAKKSINEKDLGLHLLEYKIPLTTRSDTSCASCCWRHLFRNHLVLYFTASDLKFSTDFELIRNCPRFEILPWFKDSSPNFFQILLADPWSSIEWAKQILWSMRTMLLCFWLRYGLRPTSILHLFSDKPPRVWSHFTI